jgi:hypothetical protein
VSLTLRKVREGWDTHSGGDSKGGPPACCVKTLVQASLVPTLSQKARKDGGTHFIVGLKVRATRPRIALRGWAHEPSLVYDCVPMTSTYAIMLACALSVLSFALIWAIITWSRRKWAYVAFSPHKVIHNLKTDKFEITQDEIDFGPRLAHYPKTSEIVITLSSASLVFIPRLVVSTHPEWFAFSMTLFGLCVVFLILFMVVLIYLYESSLYFPTHYTVSKSGVVGALGFTGLICFMAGYMSIAFQIAKAVGDKAIVLK